ncbi:MAG: hypothetical protein M1823_004786 [Watsoniomyces obsoletus]|nr:MAG: hypothetical protein M1823_004786 [Watsoniomyces obsoletus]
MLLPKPESTLWTLRFKNQRTTVLLYSRPDTSFNAIREELLTMLQTTNPSGEFNGATIPSEADDIILGIPNDHKDLQAGWKEVEIPEEESGDEKRPAGRRRKLGGENSTLDCPRGVGLKDGAVLAFKFRSQSSDGQDHFMNGAKMDWDVVVPSYDEDYGVSALNAAFAQGMGGGRGTLRN